MAKLGSVSEVVLLHGYVRFEKNIYFDLLPRSGPYAR
jgi:hypothetical protein